MTTMKKLLACAGLGLAVFLLPAAEPLCAQAGAKKKGEDLVILIVDDKKAVTVRWLLPKGSLPPKGFRLDRSVHRGPRETIATLVPGSPELAQGVSPEVAQTVRRYLTLAADPTRETDKKKKESFRVARFSVEVLALGDPAVARMLALSHVDRSAPAGATVTYTVVALGLAAKAESVHGSSAPTVVAPMPLPSPPTDLRTEPMRGAMLLFWSPSLLDREETYSALTYEVYRRESRSGKPTVVTERPAVISSPVGPRGEKLPTYRDRAPLVEKSAFYSVAGVDITGRRGPESPPVEAFYPDFTALDAPSQIAAVVEAGKVSLTWQAPKNPHRAGWKIVRAFNPETVGEVLNAKPVPGSSFRDETAKLGSSYWYQISAVNTRGEQGSPAISQGVLVKGGKPPGAPTKLSAERGTGRIILTWNPPAEAVTGFQVERSADGKSWMIVSRVTTTEPRFDDAYPRDASGRFLYRVISFGMDDTPSAPSEVLAVPLPDTRPPQPPVVNAIDGSGGRVTIQFSSGGGAGDAAGFFILKSRTPRDPGIVVNRDPLPAGATSFTDSDVEAGQLLFYQVVAVDAAGNRSEPPLLPSAVRVGAPALPAPPVPRAQFSAKPFPRVILEFAPSPQPSLRYALERREPKGAWRMIQGPFPRETAQVMDANPPRAGKAIYRLVAIASNGTPGPTSPAVEVEIPNR
jgi:hypothetical protein